jgi:2-oxoglutarate ferredoxin oxidoreductase subunit beta
MSSIAKKENLVYERPALRRDKEYTFCPGCGHGTVHNTILEVIEEMGLQEKTIGISPVGCAVLAYEFMNIDMQQAAHGRAPAVATAISRLQPDKAVFTYQGDGDLAAIGTAETIHACNRGENIVIFFVNNGIYGMTGGQMAPTTLPGMPSSTSPYGRDVKTMGGPMRITEMVAQLDGVYMCTRHAAHTPAHVRKLKKAVRQAFENQQAHKGLSFIEIVCNCNSGWKKPALEANKWLEEHMFPVYPLGDIKMDGKLVK